MTMTRERRLDGQAAEKIVRSQRGVCHRLFQRGGRSMRVRLGLAACAFGSHGADRLEALSAKFVFGIATHSHLH